MVLLVLLNFCSQGEELMMGAGGLADFALLHVCRFRKGGPFWQAGIHFLRDTR